MSFLRVLSFIFCCLNYFHLHVHNNLVDNPYLVTFLIRRSIYLSGMWTCIEKRLDYVLRNMITILGSIINIIEGRICTLNEHKNLYFDHE